MKAIPRIPAAVLLPGIVAAALWVAPACADVVTDWNVTANALVANDVGNNPRLRTLAMVHVAMADAINTVQKHYTRVVATLPAAPGASAEAAAATMPDSRTATGVLGIALIGRAPSWARASQALRDALADEQIGYLDDW